MSTAKEKQQARAEKRAAEAAANASPIEQLNAEATIHPDKVPAAHGEILQPQPGGAKVTVACRLGIGWYQLQLQSEQTIDEQTQTGVRQVKVWRRTGRVVRVRGTAYPRGTPPEGFPERPKMVGGAAFTPGIDKDFWDQWVDQNRQNPVVANGLLIADENEASLEARCRESAGLLSGMEPINPKSDKRMPKSTRGDIAEIQTDDTKAAAFNRALAAATSR